jgi:hypothetical protein
VPPPHDVAGMLSAAQNQIKVVGNDECLDAFKAGTVGRDIPNDAIDDRSAVDQKSGRRIDDSARVLPAVDHGLLSRKDIKYEFLNAFLKD